MFKKQIGILSIILWIVFQSITPINASNQEKKDLNILIIQSYNDEYSWTRDIIGGMRQTLKNDFFSAYNLNIRIEYMDTKNYGQKDYLLKLKEIYHYKYAEMTFDYIFAADDAAFQFALDYRKELFSNAPIFFCGINSTDPYKIEKEEKVYGIIEKSSARETLEVALKFNPNIDKVHLVIDSTDIGQWTKAEIKKELDRAFPKLLLEIYDNQGIEDIQEKIKNLDPEKEIVLMGFFAVNPDGTVYPVEKTTEMITSASSVPVYGLWSFNFPYGIVGGKLISGTDQGRRAVELFQEYLACKGCMSSYFIEYDESNKHIYDYKVLSQWHYDATEVPKDSIIIHQPENFYTKYKQAIWIIIGLLLLGTTYIIVLRYQIKMAKKRIEETHERLMQSEKLASLGNLVRGMAHEMNTPLGNAVSLSSLMDENIRETRERFENNQLSKVMLEHYFEKQASATALMQSSLTRSVDLINAFRSIALYVQSKETQNFSLNQFLKDFVTAIQPSVRHRIYLNIQEEISYSGNTEHFYTLFYELVKNTVDHGYRENEVGRIDISARIENEWLIINFSDEGKGIGPENKNRIFDPFFTTKWGTGHSGLGLFNVYNLVLSLKGNIELSHMKVDGTEFFIKLPLEK